jgi:pimeloyl-ACP methyl ester carboxylesterase
MRAGLRLPASRSRCPGSIPGAGALLLPIVLCGAGTGCRRERLSVPPATADAGADATPAADPRTPGLYAPLGGGDPNVHERSLEPPAPLPGSETARPQAAEFESVDGVALHGSLWRTGDPEAPAVVFVHDARGDRSDWDGVAAAVREALPGVTLLSIDLRGHGASTRAAGRSIRWRELSGGDYPGLRRWTGCVADVQAAVRFLRSRVQGSIPRKIALVGTGFGATAALRAAATDGIDGPGRIVTVVAVSPDWVMSYVPIESAVETLRMRKLPVLAFGAADDTRPAARTLERMSEILGDHLESHLYDDGGHGPALADRHPEMVTAIVEHLRNLLEG